MVEWFPGESREFNGVVEECWKQGKDELLVLNTIPGFNPAKCNTTDQNDSN